LFALPQYTPALNPAGPAPIINISHLYSSITSYPNSIPINNYNIIILIFDVVKILSFKMI
ncbi:MAG: hypothetical protein ACTSPN_17365, partial [Promethearchaeota archaeon]